MANISSWANKVGNFTHNSLLTSSTYNAASHIGAGATAGAVYGGASSIYNNTGTPLNDAINSAKTGAIMGAGLRYAGSKYGEGAFRATAANHMGYTTSDLARRNASLSASSQNFSMANFTHSTNTPYWNVNQTVADNVTSSTFMSRYKG